MAAGRWIPLFLIITVGADMEPFTCPEEDLAMCKEDPSMKTRFLEDACTYFDVLRNCIAQYSWECGENSALYQKMVEDMFINKEIFCKQTQPVCDEKNLEACFSKYVDLAGSDLQNPDTFPVLCRNYTEFSACYSKASAPCSGDPMFANSHWEGIFGQVKVNCLSTPECNYFEMSKCAAMLYDALSSVATIPSSTFLNSACSAYIKFGPCMTPVLTKCKLSRSAKYTDFLFQMESSSNFIETLCKKHFVDLVSHASTCYDKTEVQTQADQSCDNPLMTITFAGPPDEVSICRSYQSYVDCLRVFVETQCPDDLDAALAIGAYHESWLSQSLQTLLGIQCPPLGYNKDTQPTTTTAWIWPTGIILIPTTTRRPPPPPPTGDPFETLAPPPLPVTTMKNIEDKPGASSGDVCRPSRMFWGIFLAFITFMAI